MKRKYQFTLVLIGLLTTNFCSRDLSFTLPDINPLLSIQSFIDPDIDNKLIVTMAKPFQKPNIEMTPDCQVNLYENDLLYRKLLIDSSMFQDQFYDKSYLRFSIPDELIFSAGNEYRVEVTYPGFDKVIAKSVKPELVKIKELKWTHLTGVLPDWYYGTPWEQYSDNGSLQNKRDTSLIEFTIIFDDPPESNYYRIGVNIITKQGNNHLNDIRLQYATIDSPDPCIMKFNYETKHPLYSGWNNPTTFELLWNDKNFNGEEHTIKILIPGSAIIPAGTTYLISLYSINEDYYRYMVDRWTYSKIAEDPFAEPFKLYSNISNECGIFAFSSLDVDSVVFSKSK